MTIEKQKILEEAHRTIARGDGLLMTVRAEDVIGLMAVIEGLEKRVADLSPFKNMPVLDYRASNKCLACGEYHHGLGGLPCPKCTPVAYSAMAKEANHG